MSFHLSGLRSKYWFVLVHDQPINPPSVTYSTKVDQLGWNSLCVHSSESFPSLCPTKPCSPPSLDQDGTWGRCNWCCWPGGRVDSDPLWSHPPPVDWDGEVRSCLARDWGYLRGRSCPWTFGHLRGGAQRPGRPPGLLNPSWGGKGTLLETAPVRKGVREGRNRSWPLARSSRLGILRRRNESNQ